MKISFVLAFGLLLFSCTKKQDQAAGNELTPAQAIERGKSIYNLNCTACHNVDPSKDGSTGPAIANSTKELLEAKLLKATYPPGYKPKRDTNQMPALPHLEKEIPAITSFLNQK